MYWDIMHVAGIVCVSFLKLETSCHKITSTWRKYDMSEITKEGYMYLILGLLFSLAAKGLCSCTALGNSMQQNHPPFQGRLWEIGPWTWIMTEDRSSQILSSYRFHRNSRYILYLILWKGDSSPWQCRGVCGEKHTNQTSYSKFGHCFDMFLSTCVTRHAPTGIGPVQSTFQK